MNWKTFYVYQDGKHYLGKVIAKSITAVDKALKKRYTAAQIKRIQVFEEGKGKGSKRPYMQNAPELIYDRIIEIKAQKGDKSLWPGGLFKHSFKSGSRAQILGNPDGSLTVRSTNGTKLWKKFDY